MMSTSAIADTLLTIIIDKTRRPEVATVMKTRHRWREIIDCHRAPLAIYRPADERSCTTRCNYTLLLLSPRRVAIKFPCIQLFTKQQRVEDGSPCVRHRRQQLSQLSLPTFTREQFYNESCAIRLSRILICYTGARRAKLSAQPFRTLHQLPERTTTTVLPGAREFVNT